METVVLLSKGEIDSKKVRVEFSLEDMDMSGFQQGATYEQIKAYVLEKHGLKVSSLYISQGAKIGSKAPSARCLSTTLPEFEHHFHVLKPRPDIARTLPAGTGRQSPDQYFTVLFIAMRQSSYESWLPPAKIRR